MQKKKYIMIAVLLVCMALFCGCSEKKSRENIQAGFEAVRELKYEDALVCFEAAAQAGEDLQDIARGKGISYLGLAKYKEAIEQFIHALSYSDEFVDDFDFDTNYYLATAYFKNGQLEEAGNVYSAILDLRDDTEAHYLRGIVFLTRADKEKAKKDFDIALEKDKTNYDMYIDIAQAYKENGYEEEGKAYLQMALGNSDKKMSDYEKGRLYYYMEDFENARNYLEASKEKKDADTVLLLGQSYENLGDYNYAASIYSNYLTQNPEDVLIFNRLGMCKLRGGDAESALQYFEQALALEEPSMTQVLKFNQIVAYEYLGDFQQAGVLMKNYLAIYPDDQDAVREYEFLKSR